MADRGLQVKPTVVSAPTMAPTEDRIEEAEGLLAFSTELQQWVGPVEHWPELLGEPEGWERLASIYDERGQNTWFLWTGERGGARDAAVERQAGALRGKPRAIRFALVSTKVAPTVTVAARIARAAKDFIVNKVSGRTIKKKDEGGGRRRRRRVKSVNQCCQHVRL